jgi:hypothetical protein
MEFLKLIKDIGIFSIAMYFIQLLLSKSADRKFEVYKVELEHSSKEFQNKLDTNLQLFKAKIDFENFKSTKVYERQLSVIVDLHSKLVQLNFSMREMTAIFKQVGESFEKEEEDRIRNTVSSYNEFLIFYEKHKIFLPDKTISSLDKIRDDYFSIFIDYTHGKKYASLDNEARLKMFNASERMKNEIQPSLKLLIDDFRFLLGPEIREKDVV